eukprot:scaffold11843_cov152-Amphora_coffeaeformis.AAC.5
MRSYNGIWVLVVTTVFFLVVPPVASFVPTKGKHPSRNHCGGTWSTPHTTLTAANHADIVFLERFERCELCESEWTHTAHVRVAWVALMTTSEEAQDRIRKGIQTYNTQVLQRPDAFHETITVAFIRLIRSRLQCHNDDSSWEEFCHTNQDVLDPKCLLQFYSRERLFSDEARKQFVAPDLSPLPST